jgi:hypothetical protein
MWRKLNNILSDRNEYYLDPVLKNEIDISNDLFHASIKSQKYLFVKKIKYFIEYDKSYFVRFLLKYILKFLIVLTSISLLTLFVMFIFGVNFDVKKIQRANYSSVPIYIPSSGDLKEDSITLMRYKKVYDKNGNFIFFYLKDPSKNFEKWKEKLHNIESGGMTNPYSARRENSQFWGKYQLGEYARKSINLGGVTWETWKNNPELQEAALKMWIKIIYSDLKPEIQKYDGKFLSGWNITESGIIAMGHNVGPAPVKTFLNSGGKIIPKDGSGKDATRFLILGNYDLELNK